MRIGDIKVVNEIIDLRYQLTRTQLILDTLLKEKKVNISKIQLKQIDAIAVEDLGDRYPNMLKGK
jgi:hypothetical protein